MYSGLRSHKVNAGHTCVNNLIGTLCEVCSLYSLLLGCPGPFVNVHSLVRLE
jgi:hypothetical protein